MMDTRQTGGGAPHALRYIRLLSGLLLLAVALGGIVIEMALATNLRESASQTTSVIEYLSLNFGRKERGRQLVEDICTYCHNLEKLDGQQRTRQEWRDLTKGMIFEGAPVTDEEFSTILDYLAKYYGPKGPEE